MMLALAVIIGALVWGSMLAKRSEEYRADKEAGRWELNAETAIPQSVPVPSVRAVEIIPEGNVGDILIAGDHGGVMLPFFDDAGAVNYQSDVAPAAGLTVATEAPVLSEDVQRVSRRGLHVTLIVSLRYPEEADPAMRLYRRGLELALLREAAAAGMDDLLLLGLPTGSESANADTVAFLGDLKESLCTLPSPPAIGVAIPPESFVGGVDEEGDPIYAGNPAPARLLRVCDYLALDLQALHAEGASDLLQRMQYAYVRYSLRVLVNRDEAEVSDTLLACGIQRIFEMKGIGINPG